MSRPKFKTGKQIKSISDFDQSECMYFKVRFGNKLQTKHKSFLTSWQYILLKRFIQAGSIFEAEPVNATT